MPEEDKTKGQTEEQNNEAETKENWDKDKQRADQAEANVKKLAEDKAELSSKLDAATEQLTTVQEQSESLGATVEQLESQLKAAKAEKAEQDELDPDLHDPGLIKKINSLETQLTNDKALFEDAQKQIKQLSDKAVQYEADRKKEQEDAARAERKEDILTKLDERYNPKFRNEAVKLAQEEVDKDGKAPKGELGAYLLLEKHYKQLSEKALKDEAEKETTVPADPGTGGIGFKEGEIKEGSLREVAKQVKAKYKGKGFTLPTP